MYRFLALIIISFMLFSQTAYSQTYKNIKKIQVKIGSSDKFGGHYPLAVSFAKVLKINSKIHGLYPEVVETEGSVYNIDNVVNGSLMSAIVEEDVQYRAYYGRGEWAGMPQREIRTIANLAPEVIQLIVSESSNIKTLMDIENKKINLGMAGTGTRYNAENIIKSYGFDNKTVFVDEQYTISDSFKMIQDGRLDGFFMTALVPLKSLQNLSEISKIRFIDITNVNKMLYTYNGYNILTIPKVYYPRALNPNGPKTVSADATIITSSKTSNYSAYIMAKEIVENIEILKKMHPALSNINIKDLVKTNAAPIHPGAVRYYLDKGLM